MLHEFNYLKKTVIKEVGMIGFILKALFFGALPWIYNFAAAEISSKPISLITQSLGSALFVALYILVVIAKKAYDLEVPKIAIEFGQPEEGFIVLDNSYGSHSEKVIRVLPTTTVADHITATVNSVEKLIDGKWILTSLNEALELRWSNQLQHGTHHIVPGLRQFVDVVHINRHGQAFLCSGNTPVRANDVLWPTGTYKINLLFYSGGVAQPVHISLKLDRTENSTVFNVIKM